MWLNTWITCLVSIHYWIADPTILKPNFNRTQNFAFRFDSHQLSHEEKIGNCEFVTWFDSSEPCYFHIIIPRCSVARQVNFFLLMPYIYQLFNHFHNLVVLFYINNIYICLFRNYPF